MCLNYTAGFKPGTLGYGGGNIFLILSLSYKNCTYLNFSAFQSTEINLKHIYVYKTYIQPSDKFLTMNIPTIANDSNYKKKST